MNSVDPFDLPADVEANDSSAETSDSDSQDTVHPRLSALDEPRTAEGQRLAKKIKKARLHPQTDAVKAAIQRHMTVIAGHEGWFRRRKVWLESLNTEIPPRSTNEGYAGSLVRKSGV